MSTDLVLKPIRRFWNSSQDRFGKESFFVPKTSEKRKEEATGDVRKVGFIVTYIEDHKETEHYRNEDELMDLIEMVPLVTDFDRIRDRKRLADLARKYRDMEGIPITWHYHILKANRS